MDPQHQGVLTARASKDLPYLRASHMKLIRVFEISQVLEEAFSLYHEIKDCRVLSIIRKL